jgi:hypothetical protein
MPDQIGGKKTQLASIPDQIGRQRTQMASMPDRNTQTYTVTDWCHVYHSASTLFLPNIRFFFDESFFFNLRIFIL